MAVNLTFLKVMLTRGGENKVVQDVKFDRFAFLKAKIQALHCYIDLTELFFNIYIVAFLFFPLKLKGGVKSSRTFKRTFKRLESIIIK